MVQGVSKSTVKTGFALEKAQTTFTTTPIHDGALSDSVKAFPGRREVRRHHPHQRRDAVGRNRPVRHGRHAPDDGQCDRPYQRRAGGRRGRHPRRAADDREPAQDHQERLQDHHPAGRAGSVGAAGARRRGRNRRLPGRRYVRCGLCDPGLRRQGRGAAAEVPGRRRRGAWRPAGRRRSLLGRGAGGPDRSARRGRRRPRQRARAGRRDLGGRRPDPGRRQSADQGRPRRGPAEIRFRRKPAPDQAAGRRLDRERLLHRGGRRWSGRGGGFRHRGAGAGQERRRGQHRRQFRHRLRRRRQGVVDPETRRQGGGRGDRGQLRRGRHGLCRRALQIRHAGPGGPGRLGFLSSDVPGESRSRSTARTSG